MTMTISVKLGQIQLNRIKSIKSYPESWTKTKQSNNDIDSTYIYTYFVAILWR